MTAQPHTATEPDRSLDEILAGYLKAAEAGQPAGPQMLLASHPELAGFLAGLDQVEKLAAPLRAARRPAPSCPAGGIILLVPGTETVVQVLPDQDGREVQPDLADGGEVSGHRILGVLGRGGMGVVYKALHVRLKRLVALKMIRPSDHAGEVELARFRAEAEAVARLHHPHVVQIYEAGDHRGQPFCSLEFVSGGTLAKRLGNPPQPAHHSAELVRTLALTVDVAHRRGIVHRDLKPSNVLLAEDGSPKITDFGLAKQLDDDVFRTTTVPVVVRKTSYVASDQAAGHREIGGRPDVYALGVIRYEMLTGRPPFRGATVLETLEQVRTSAPVPVRLLRPDAPRDLETICLECLSKEPRRRYPSARALADGLGRFLDGRPILARPAGRTERVLRWCWKNPAPVSLAAVTSLALVLLPLLATWLWRANEAADWEARNAVAHRYAFLLNSAREGIRHRHPGWTWAGLEKTEEAGRLQTSLRNLHDLRAEAVTCLGGMDFRKKAVLHGGSPQCALAFRPDGKVLAASHLHSTDAISLRPVLLIDPASGRVLSTLFFPPCRDWSRSTKRGDGTHSLAFSHDGRRLAAGPRNGHVYLWNLDAPDSGPFCCKAANKVDVDALVFSRDGGPLYTLCNKEQTLVRWDASRGKEQAKRTASNDLAGPAFHPDGVRLMLLVRNELAAHVWHLDRVWERLATMGLTDALSQRHWRN